MYGTSNYDAVYGNPQKGKSFINTHKDDSSAAGYHAVYGTSSYDAVYGNPQKGKSFINTHKDASSDAGYHAVYGTSSYDAVYGNPQKGKSFINTHKDASSAAGYHAVYGTSSYDAVYGNPQKGKSFINTHKDASSAAGYHAVYGTSSYDAVYGNPQKGKSFINTHKDDSSAAGYHAVYGTSNYDAVYGNPQKGESSINTRKEASSVAGYTAVYGTSQKTGESSYDGVYRNSQKAGGSSYNAVYRTPQNARGSSVSAGKNSPNTEQAGHRDGAGLNVFLEKDLHPGTKMMVQFTKTSSEAHFLPRQVAESIPFSSNKLPEILNRFSVKDFSAEAKIIENTIKECEGPAIEGEDKYCARSLESLIDFSTSRLGKNIRVIPNVVEGKIQEYKFEDGVEMVGEKSVVCHQLNYPYAVALCHVFQETKVYKVPLVGADGIRVKALAVCHEDTSTWAPDAMAFQLLKVEPGTLPICHFLPNGHFVWIPK